MHRIMLHEVENIENLRKQAQFNKLGQNKYIKD